MIGSQLSDTLWAVALGAVIGGVFGLVTAALTGRYVRTTARENRRADNAERLQERRERHLRDLQDAMAEYADAITVGLSNAIIHGGSLTPDDTQRLFRAQGGLRQVAMRIGDPSTDEAVADLKRLTIQFMGGDLKLGDEDKLDSPIARLQRRIAELFRELESEQGPSSSS